MKIWKNKKAVEAVKELGKETAKEDLSWAEEMAKQVDEEFKDKSAKKKKSADELFRKMGYEKLLETDESVEYQNQDTYIVICREDKDYSVMATVDTDEDSPAQWLNSKENKAVRRKAKELGWI